MLNTQPPITKPITKRSPWLRRSLLMPGLTLLLALALALLLAVGWLGAPRQDVVELIQYLLLSGVLSFALGAATLRWLRRGHGRLWLQVSAVYVLGVAIVLLNIFVTAGLMFISLHDLLLLVLLLLFAAVVSLGLGVALAHELSGRVATLHERTQALAGGDLHARVVSVGTDELADLGAEFNRMANLLAEGEAERSRMDASRRDLVAAISHDLRTPLTSLRALTEALADGLVEDPATQARYLATMRTQTNLLNSLINDLFELAQLDAGALRLERQRVAPGDLVSDIIEGLRPQADARGVTLLGHVAPELGLVPVEPQKIERVLGNLVTNAIRHTPTDGTITLSVRLAGEQDGASSGPAVLFEVRDTGEGIPPEDQPFVFDRFYRGEKSRSRTTGGAGLGLAIAHGIVEAHGGRIWIAPTPPPGTAFRFTLPIQAA